MSSQEINPASPRGCQTRWTFGPATLEGSPAEERQFLQEVMNVVAGLQCDLVDHRRPRRRQVIRYPPWPSTTASTSAR